MIDERPWATDAVYASEPEIMPGEYDMPPPWVRVMRVRIIGCAFVLGCTFAAGIAVLAWRLG